MRPDMATCLELHAGQVGYIICSMKTVKVLQFIIIFLLFFQEAAVGETLFDPSEESTITAFPGFKPIKPTLYAGLFPVETSSYEGLKQVQCPL